jgi:hypothetical protein
MSNSKKIAAFILGFIMLLACSRHLYSIQVGKDGYTLAWSDEFNQEGRPDSTNWTYERGFVRNEELQWYQQENATCKMACW